MVYYGSLAPSATDIEHHGVKGQKWGVRRYVDPSGHLTSEGRSRALAAYERYKNSPSYIKKVKKYKKKGMSEEEAVFRAGRSESHKRKITALGGVGLLAAAHPLSNEVKKYSYGTGVSMEDHMTKVGAALAGKYVWDKARQATNKKHKADISEATKRALRRK